MRNKVIKAEDVDELVRIANRERAPIYVIGEITDDHRFVFESEKTGEKPMDLELADMFGKPPQTIMEDRTLNMRYKDIKADASQLKSYLEAVMQLEAVACKDWLTNKVDRSVTGKIAKQQCAGTLQLPLNNLGAVTKDRGDLDSAIDYLKRSLEIKEKLAPGSLMVANSLTNLGHVALLRGDLDSATDYLERSFNIKEKLGPPTLT